MSENSVGLLTPSGAKQTFSLASMTDSSGIHLDVGDIFELVVYQVGPANGLGNTIPNVKYRYRGMFLGTRPRPRGMDVLELDDGLMRRDWWLYPNDDRRIEKIA